MVENNEKSSEMKPKWMKRDWIWLALIGLLIQGIWALSLEHPSYMDAYYYATNGQRLAGGFGFTEEVIWQYLDNPGQLPVPSHSYWLPLPSILAAAGYMFADSFRAAQIPFWLLAGFLPVLSFVIALQFSNERWMIWAAGLFTATGGYYSRFFNQPSTFAPFAMFGGLCLLFMAWAQTKGRWYWWFLAGVTAGLGHLTRADGLLLLGVAGLMWLYSCWHWWQHRTEQGIRLPILPIFFLFVGYFLVMGGWFLHMWRVTGRPLSTAGTQTMFLTWYDDIFAYGRTFDLQHYLAWGWGNIIESKIQGVSMAAQTYIAVSGLVFLGPFIIWAWIKWGRQREKWLVLRPLTWYTILLFIFMSLVFTWPGQRGGLLHSSAAIWTWMMVLAAGGIGVAVDWVAKRLPHWQPAKAKPIFSALFVVIAFIIAIATLRSSNELEALAYKEAIKLMPTDAVIMSGNAPSVYYHTGHQSLSVPNEPPEIMLQAAADYNVSFLILDDGRPRPLAEIYEGTVEHPGITLLETYEGKEGDYKLYQLDPSLNE